MTSPDRYRAPHALAAPISGDERERVVQALCVHFASDHIGMESLEQRLAVAYAAHTHGELHDAIGDLPSLHEQRDELGVAPRPIAPGAVPERGVAMAVMGGVSRKGSWALPRDLKVIAVMGGAEIDLREAKFGPGVTEISAYALMGGVEIIVPPGVRVESVGGAFMGGFDANAGDASITDPLAPILRVSGMAVMGGVEVKTRRPGKKTLARFQAALYAAGLTDNVDDDS